MLFCCLLIFFNQLFQEVISEYYQSVNKFGPDQEPTKGVTCLQGLSVEDTIE